MVAETWGGAADMFPSEQNFMLSGECLAGWASAFRFPSGAAIVDVLRNHSGARITTGQPRKTLDSLDLGTDTEGLAFAEQFRAAPLDQVLSEPFALAHFGLEAFDIPGGLLEGLRAQLVEPWAVALQSAGFTFHRCYPILFITNTGGKCADTSYHMDKSNVVACQVHGRKRWTWLREPSKWADQETRLTHTAGQLQRPDELTEDDTVVAEMGPGDCLFNKLLTPHWVEGVGDEVAVSLNISHGGLALNGKLMRNEDELMQYIMRERGGAAQDNRPEAVVGKFTPVGDTPAWGGLPGQHQAKF